MASCIIASTGTYGRDHSSLLGKENGVLSSEVKYVHFNNKLSDATQTMQKNNHKQEIEINKAPIICDLNTILPSISLKMVSNSIHEQLWDQLVSNYHYLGYKNLLGHRLKYLAFSDMRPIAAFSWSAPALKLRSRDNFIGWSDNQRKEHLKRIANNSF